MFKCINNTPRPVFKLTDRVLDNGACCVIDQTANREFFLNPFGWIRSSIAQIAAAQTMEQYRLVADSIQKLAPQFNMSPSKDGKVSSFTKAELERAINFVKPRSCQLSFEVEQFAKVLSSYDSKLIDQAYIKSLEDEKIVSDEKSAEASNATAGS